MPAHARELDEDAAALLPEAGDDAACQLDRAGEVGREQVFDLPVAEVLGSAEDAGAGVGDDDVDGAELGERRVDHVGQGGDVRDVQLPGPQPLAERVPEVVQLFRVAEGRRDAVAAGEELLGQFAADAARGSSDQPGTHASRLACYFRIVSADFASIYAVKEWLES